MLYQAYTAPATLVEALRVKRDLGAKARVCAGGTDLLLELERKPEPELTLLDITRIPGLADIREDAGRFRLGPLVTHNQCVAHPRIRSDAFPLARACWEVGAPALRNRATVAGNLVTASPANDTIVPLALLDTVVTAASLERGERELPLADFITGYRETALEPDELVTGISFRGLGREERGAFVKLGLRHAQAISVVSAAITLVVEEGRLADLRIGLGAVDATIIRASAAEERGRGRRLDDETIDAVSELAAQAASPQDDVRGGADYRRAMVAALARRALQALARGQEQAGWEPTQVMLWGSHEGRYPSAGAAWRPEDEAMVNGRPVRVFPGRTLLHSLREAGCLEVKEGCGEGECGSCTVFLDDKAVLSCLIPAERAAGCEVSTALGLSPDSTLTSLQQAFVNCGGVQCGFCIPGFVMSGTKLLQEVQRPTASQVEEAYMGNLCRCTGYAKILEATLAAASGPQG